MLSKLIENNNKKCAIYWPTYTGTPTMFGHIIVTLISIEHIANYSIRTFKVKHSTMVDDERIVTQFQVSFHNQIFKTFGLLNSKLFFL